MSDEWIVLEPRRGKRREENFRVTMAWRRCTAGGSLSGYLNVSKALADKMGWPEKGRLQIAHNPACTMLRVEPADEGQSMHSKSGCRAFQAALPWVQSEPQGAETVEHQIKGVALLLTLPEWAAQKPALKPLNRPAIPLVEPKPAPSPEVEKIDTPAPAVTPPPKWTAERKDLLRTLWLARTDTAEIAARLNALPGLPIVRNEISAYAVAGLKLPSLSAMAAAAEAEARQAAPIPRPQTPPPRAADDKAEAIKLLEAGLSGREVADEMGLPLSVVSNWAAEVRLKARRGEKAA